MKSSISISHDGEKVKAVLFLTYSDMSRHGWKEQGVSTENGTIWRMVSEDDPFTIPIQPETSELVSNGCFWTFTCDMDHWTWYQNDLWVEYPIKWTKSNEVYIDLEPVRDPEEELKVFEYIAQSVSKTDGYVLAANKEEATAIVESALHWGHYSNNKIYDGEFEFHHHNVFVDETDYIPQKWERVLKRPTSVIKESEDESGQKEAGSVFEMG